MITAQLEAAVISVVNFVAAAALVALALRALIVYHGQVVRQAQAVQVARQDARVTDIAAIQWVLHHPMSLTSPLREAQVQALLCPPWRAAPPDRPLCDFSFKEAHLCSRSSELPPDLLSTFTRQADAAKTLAQEVAAFLARSGYVLWRYQAAVEFVTQNPAAAADLPGTVHHACAAVLEALHARLSASQAAQWRIQRRCKWQGESRKHPGVTLVPAHQAGEHFTTWTGVRFEEKGSRRWPKLEAARKQAAAISRANRQSKLLEVSEADMLAQRAAAIDQVVEYLAHAASCAHGANLALPFHRSCGAAICGAYVCLIVLTVQGSDDEVAAVGRRRTGPDDAAVVVSITDWMPYLPAEESDFTTPEGLVLLANVMLSHPSTLCYDNSFAALMPKLLPQNFVSAGAPITILGRGRYGFVLRASAGKFGQVAVKVPMPANAEGRGPANPSRAGATEVQTEAAIMRMLEAPPLSCSANLASLASNLLRDVTDGATAGQVASGSRPAAAPSSYSWPNCVAKLVCESERAIVLAPVGTCLRDRLQQEEFADASNRLAYLQQLLPGMLRALVHCHARGVLHKDVRTANFILVADESDHHDGAPDAGALDACIGAGAGVGAATVQKSRGGAGPATATRVTALHRRERVVLIDFGLATATAASDDRLSSAGLAEQRNFGAPDIAQLVHLVHKTAGKGLYLHMLPSRSDIEAGYAFDMISSFYPAREGARGGAGAGAGTRARNGAGSVAGEGAGTDALATRRLCGRGRAGLIARAAEAGEGAGAIT